MFCPKCGTELRSDFLNCQACGKELPLDVLLSEARTVEEKLEYFETLPRAGDGLCSDLKCPCPEVPIPHGCGYLYVSKEAVEFRRDARTLEEFQKKLQRMEEQSNYLIMIDPELASGVLVCEQGAKLRNLDLEVAAADARRWWETGLIPLRPTPTVGTGSVVNKSSPKKEQFGQVGPEKGNRTPENARPRSASSRPTAQEVMNDILCFVCGMKPAAPSDPIVVSLKKQSQFMEVQVPACRECHVQEAAGERRANGIGLAVSILPIILGVVVGWPDYWLQLGFLGLGVGWLGGIVVQAFLCGRGKSCQHPEIKEMTEHGWDFNHLY